MQKLAKFALCLGLLIATENAEGAAISPSPSSAISTTVHKQHTGNRLEHYSRGMYAHPSPAKRIKRAFEHAGSSIRHAAETVEDAFEAFGRKVEEGVTHFAKKIERTFHPSLEDQLDDAVISETRNVLRKIPFVREHADDIIDEIEHLK